MTWKTNRRQNAIRKTDHWRKVKRHAGDGSPGQGDLRVGGRAAGRRHTALQQGGVAGIRRYQAGCRKTDLRVAGRLRRAASQDVAAGRRRRVRRRKAGRRKAALSSLGWL